MKKSILFIFGLIPILACCGNNDKGFPNPFPGDKDPIGFNIEEEGKIFRPLTSQESTLINLTVENAKSKNYYSDIKEKIISVQDRDYSRAFAGVFAKGYDTSNKKIDGTINVYRQDISNDITRLRNVTKTDLVTLFDYSYGRKTENTDTIKFNYLATSNGSTYSETNEVGSATSTIYQTFKNDGSESLANPIDKGILDIKDAEDPDNWYEPSVTISQEDSIFNTAEATTLPGVNKEGKPVLIKETHTPYGDDGIYKLEDGREYRAAVNTLIVSTLVKEIHEGEDWYMVSYSRHYTETVITSDVIQPNVPISYLPNPIVISYSEEISKYNGETTYIDQPDIPDVTIEESIL